jgi:hypothetical protein
MTRGFAEGVRRQPASLAGLAAARAREQDDTKVRA